MTGLQRRIEVRALGMNRNPALIDGVLLDALAACSPPDQFTQRHEGIGRWLDPTSRAAITAIAAAAERPARDPEVAGPSPYRCGVVAYTQRGPIRTRRKMFAGVEREDMSRLSATLFSHCGYNMAAGVAAIAHELKGPNLTLSGSGNLAIDALTRACALLMSDRADQIYAGFSETVLTPAGVEAELSAFLRIEAEPASASRTVEGVPISVTDISATSSGIANSAHAEMWASLHQSIGNLVGHAGKAFQWSKDRQSGTTRLMEIGVPDMLLGPDHKTLLQVAALVARSRVEPSSIFVLPIRNGLRCSLVAIGGR